MLSYRHSYHAGNFADVLKHCVLVHSLEYMKKKEKPFRVIDTHAGVGVYSLLSKASGKTQEYENGIGKLWSSNNKNIPDALDKYLECVAGLNKTKNLVLYPGSPGIIQQFIRRQDSAYFHELHPADFLKLEKMTESYRNLYARKEDGFVGLKALLPPIEKRGLILVDPSYEIKTEYEDVVKNICTAYKRFPTGTYILWYPVIDRHRINYMERKFKSSGIRNIQLFELGIRKDSAEYGMTASGMIIINPAWSLKKEMEICLPYLAELLSENNEGSFRQVELVPE